VKDAGIRVTMSVLWACLSRPILGKSEEGLEGLIAALEKRKNNTGKRGKEAPENGQASNWSNGWIEDKLSGSQGGSGKT
jgi:hypothetical protein